MQVVLSPAFHAAVVFSLICEGDDAVLAVDISPQDRVAGTNASQTVALEIGLAQDLLGEAQTVSETEYWSDEQIRDGMTSLVRFVDDGELRQRSAHSPRSGTPIYDLSARLVSLGSLFTDDAVTQAVDEIGRYLRD
jgi:hypothetical protein